MNFNEKEELKKQYFISRDTVQMEKIFIIEMNVKKYEEHIYSDENNVNISMKRTLKNIDEKKIEGILFANIKIEHNEICLIEFNIVYKGLFVSAETLDDFHDRVDLQMVPQMWPYLRTSVTNLSIMFNMPPVILPTIDILNTLKNNNLGK